MCPPINITPNRDSNLMVAAAACAGASYFYAYWFSDGLA
jgi:hypothetical protein